MLVMSVTHTFAMNLDQQKNNVWINLGLQNIEIKKSVIFF